MVQITKHQKCKIKGKQILSATSSKNTKIKIKHM